MKVKRFVSMLLLLIAMSAFALPVSAVGIASEVAVMDASPTPHWEETQWFFRINNGVPEQRLWSHTFGRWITVWHPVVP
jgi:hypothetical protein